MYANKGGKSFLALNQLIQLHIKPLINARKTTHWFTLIRKIEDTNKQNEDKYF